MREGFDMEPVRWDDKAGHVALLDQRLLPLKERWVVCDSVEAVADAISNLTVRGAPAIGVTAAYGMAVAALEWGSGDPSEPGLAGAREWLVEAGALLAVSRPTAVNLSWAVERQLDVMRAGHADVGELCRSLLDSAKRVHAGEVEACHSIGRHGAALLEGRSHFLTHCNAGALATGGYGTALGVLRAVVEGGRDIHVWVDETRPVLQGARLTTWELTRAGIPNTLIPDGAAAAAMARGEVDAVVVGADRIAANGDVANKIGTYGLALAAAAHEIPFVVAAPVSTIDLACPSGDAIVIEERDPDEVRKVAGADVTAPGQPVANWAFDVTPGSLVTAIVTENGPATAPYAASLREHASP